MTRIMDSITLEFYHDAYAQQADHYKLSPEQREFTSMPIPAIELCGVEENRHPVMILQKSRLAGFFVLQGWEGAKLYCDNQNSLLLRAYSVDADYQGKGIARRSLELLPAFAEEHFPEKNEIVLAVNERNRAARHVYEKAGFRDTGRRIMGRKGLQHILHVALKEEAGQMGHE